MPEPFNTPPGTPARRVEVALHEALDALDMADRVIVNDMQYSERAVATNALVMAGRRNVKDALTEISA